MKTSWSFSSLMDYERCPHTQSFKNQWGGEKPSNAAALRGIEMHAKCAEYIQFGGEIPAPGFPWDSLANAIPEKKFGLSNTWERVDYKDAWLKVIPDALIVTPSGITVVDFKTGKREFKEIKHSQQMQLYACAMDSIWLEGRPVTTELWYLDTPGHIHRVVNSPSRLKGIRGRLHLRADTMLSDTELKPKPNRSNCRFCNHNPTQGGACEYAYEDL